MCEHRCALRTWRRNDGVRGRVYVGMRQVHISCGRLHEFVLHGEYAGLIGPKLVYKSLVVAFVVNDGVRALDGLISLGKVGWQVMEPQLDDPHA